MGRRKLLGRSELLLGTLLLACGQATSSGASIATGGTGGFATGGGISIATGGAGGQAQPGFNSLQLCECAFEQGNPGAGGPPSFRGTFDGEAVELSSEGLKTLRFGAHLEAIGIAFTIGSEYDGSIQVSATSCEAQGYLLSRGVNGVMGYPSASGWLRASIKTENWIAGIATGTLHVEYRTEAGPVAHVLDASFAMPASLPNAQQ